MRVAGTVLDAATADERLAEVGVPTVRTAIVYDLAGVAAAADDLGPGPIVLKAGGLIHKTGEGGVILDLQGSDAVAAAAAELEGRLGARSLPFVLQQQVGGYEILVGVRRDAELGAAIVVGMGGVETEIHHDITHGLVPVSADDALAMLRSLRVWPLLDGFRGRPKRDVAALVEVVTAVSRMVDADPTIVELDLNPVLVGDEGMGCVVVDARIVVDSAAAVLNERPRLDLTRMMEPKHIAVIGVSDDTDKVGSRLFRYLVEHRFPGQLDPVNPSGGEVAGRTRYLSLAEVPGSPDLVCIAVPARFVPAVLDEAIAKKVGGVIVHSSDFAEVGDAGREAQRAIAEKAQAAGIPLIGPNCMGIVAPHLDLAASISGGMETGLVPGNVALLTSSGALGSCLASRLLGSGIGLSRWVHAGNEADRTIADYLEWLADDEHTRTVGLLLEDVKDGPRFIEAARRIIAAGKPVFAYSMARSDMGREAALSHTGAMVGSFAMREAVLRVAGVVSVPSLRTLEDALMLASTTRMPKGKRFVAVTLSGGACSIIADESEAGGIELPTIDPVTQERVKEFVPDYAAVRNPLDCSYQMLASPENFERTLSALVESGLYDALLLQFTTNADPYAARLADAVVAVRDRVDIPVYVSRYGGEQLAPKALAVYRAAGIPVMDAPDRATQALAAIMNSGV